MIHLVLIWALGSVCVGLIWALVGVMDKNKRLELECDALNNELTRRHDKEIERLKIQHEYLEGCG